MFFLANSILTGKITGYGVNPIQNSVANKGMVADYTFAFVPEIAVPAKGLIVVSFPSQYVSGLGISGTPSCSLACTVSGYNVTFTLTSAIEAGSSKISG